jgi:carbonic anhydrase
MFRHQESSRFASVSLKSCSLLFILAAVFNIRTSLAVGTPTTVSTTSKSPSGSTTSAQHTDGKDHWRYYGIYGPSNWSARYDDCDDVKHHHQSPINIEISVAHLDDQLEAIDLIQPFITNSTVTLVNNGHTVNFGYDNSFPVRLKGGNFKSSYRVAGVHFHWGINDTEGSEHRINGKPFPMEMHVVSYNEDRYSGVLDASIADDGREDAIAVLGVLFRVSENDNPKLSPLISKLENVRVAGHPMNISSVDLRDLLPVDKSKYFRYNGSLTTPPCSEKVIWSVFAQALNISSKQLSAFREMEEESKTGERVEYLKFNWRPVEPVVDRIVIRNFSPPKIGRYMDGDSGHYGDHGYTYDPDWNSYYGWYWNWGSSGATLGNSLSLSLLLNVIVFLRIR